MCPFLTTDAAIGGENFMCPYHFLFVVVVVERSALSPVLLAFLSYFNWVGRSDSFKGLTLIRCTL